MQPLISLAWFIYYTTIKVVVKPLKYYYVYKWFPLRTLSLCLTGKAYYKDRNQNIAIVTFKRLAMFDFDIPDKVHHASSVTYSSRDKIYSRVEWAAKLKSLLFWVEETPGGVHIWLLSEQLNFDLDRDRIRFHYLAKVLNCDPLYRRICLGRRRSACRVSPKKRFSVMQEDKVAKYVGLIGDHSLVDKKCLQDFRFYLKYWSRYQNPEIINHAYSVVEYLENYPDY